MTLTPIKPQKSKNPIHVLLEAKRFHAEGRTVLKGWHLLERADGRGSAYIPLDGFCRACVLGAAYAMADDSIRDRVDGVLWGAADRLRFNLRSMTDSRTRRRLSPEQIAAVYDLAIEIVKGRA